MLMQKIVPLLALATLFFPTLTTAQYYNGDPQITPSGPPDIVFPVLGGATFTNDFQDARYNHLHEGNDLKAPKMTQILAARGGRVTFAPMDQPSYGYMLSISGDDGYKYNYIHINNDNLNTDDGMGGPTRAYAPGISEGVMVTQGQHIAWVGDSGNAENTFPHLHFEIRLPDNTAINPYPYLNAALQIYTYDVAVARDNSATINQDKGLVGGALPLYCEIGSLIRTVEYTSVYYCGADGQRYVFPNSGTYATWYADFSTVKTIPPADMAQIPLGGNVTYRPGVKLVKIVSDPKVYAIDRNGTLRWITTDALAVKYYGKSWAAQVDDVPDVFFINYKVGDPITN